VATHKLRSVNTHFWDDGYIINLDPIEKLLFLYFLTNPLTNLAGIYEISIRRIAFDTGIDKEMVLKIIKRFEKDKKAYYFEGFIYLPNFQKNQRLTSTMLKNVEKTIQDLPESVKKFYSQTHGCPIDTLSIPYREEEVEEEIEEEVEEEDKEKKNIPTYEEFEEYAKTLSIWNDSFEFQLQAKYESWIENKWKDGNGKKIKNWKTKLKNTMPYFRKNGSFNKFQDNLPARLDSSEMKELLSTTSDKYKIQAQYDYDHPSGTYTLKRGRT